MLDPARNWILNPSDFAFLWEECRRCFYLKVADNFPRPKLLLPKIFKIIDTHMKEFYAGKPTRDTMPFLPPGVVVAGADWVRSVPLAVPGHTSTCAIRGRVDSVLRFDDGSYGVIDFKTSGTTRRQTELYSRQLHAYAVALENAASKSLSLAPVTKLGLVVFEPDTFSGGSNGPACLSGPVNWVEILRDDSGFFAFLKEVLDILTLPTPPDASPACEWCRYRDTSRRTGL